MTTMRREATGSVSSARAGQVRRGRHSRGTASSRPPPGAPQWYVDEPWVRPGPPLPDGTRMVGGALKNTLIRSAAVVEHDLRFDEAFGSTGGEDGAVLLHGGAPGRFPSLCGRCSCRGDGAAESHESAVPASSRRVVREHRSDHGDRLRMAARVRIAASSIKRMASGPAHILAQVRAGKTSEWRWALALSLMGVGRLAGVFGVRVHHSSMNARAARAAAKSS